jgi:uncharacterized repeat protein (TIGR01451 family)
MRYAESDLHWPTRQPVSHRTRRWAAWPVVLPLFFAVLTSQAVGQPNAQNAPTATGSGPLELEIVLETLAIDTGPGGVETRMWEPAGRLSAGDELYYTIRVRNSGKEPVTDIVVTKRLPFGVHYIRGSAVGPACTVQFSIDGGKTFAVPAKLGVIPGSKRAARKIAPSEYTHVRWIFGKPLVPNATSLLRFRATFT